MKRSLIKLKDYLKYSLQFFWKAPRYTVKTKSIVFKNFNPFTKATIEVILRH